MPNPNSAKEFAAGYRTAHPRADKTSVDYDPYYVSIPFSYHQSYPAGSVSASFVDNGFREQYDSMASDAYQIHFAGGRYTEYLFAGPDIAHILQQYI